jgi:hypothetical protein
VKDKNFNLWKPHFNVFEIVSRCGVRNGNVSFTTKHPALSPHHVLTTMLGKRAYERVMHDGAFTEPEMPILDPERNKHCEWHSAKAHCASEIPRKTTLSTSLATILSPGSSSIYTYWTGPQYVFKEVLDFLVHVLCDSSCASRSRFR